MNFPERHMLALVLAWLALLGCLLYPRAPQLGDVMPRGLCYSASDSRLGSA